MDAAFGYFDIDYPENKATVILRDENKRNIEYEDTPETKRMHDLLIRYNRLLERTFIDMPSLDQPRIELGDKENRRRNNKPVFVNITHHEKFGRRIFNNSTFDDGGRFCGGWWQHVDGSYRKAIRINNLPTVEIDYSSLHVILAYAMVGDDYWKLTDDDPYELPVRGVNNPDHCREMTKLLFLLGFNASDEQSLFKAFRSELDYTAYPYSVPDYVLSELLDGIKNRHPKISHLICSGAGLRLINLDSRICEYVTEKFVERDTPILTVHDSFIVPFGAERELDRVMKEAFKRVTETRHVKAKYNQNLTEAQLYASRAVYRDFYLDKVMSIQQPEVTKGYRLRMERHNINLM